MVFTWQRLQGGFLVNLETNSSLRHGFIAQNYLDTNLRPHFNRPYCTLTLLM